MISNWALGICGNTYRYEGFSAHIVFQLQFQSFISHLIAKKLIVDMGALVFIKSSTVQYSPFDDSDASIMIFKNVRNSEHDTHDETNFVSSQLTAVYGRAKCIGSWTIRIKELVLPNDVHLANLNCHLVSVDQLCDQETLLPSQVRNCYFGNYRISMLSKSLP